MKFVTLAFAVVSLVAPGASSQQSDSGSAMKMDQAMPGMRSLPPARPLPGMSIFNLNGYWTTQDRVREPLSALRGKPILAAMIYTHCRDVCPLIAEHMQEVERLLPAPERGSVRFVLFSLDWMRDTPDQLRHFASQHGLVTPGWILFHGDEAAVRELAAALGVSFYRGADGDFQHSIALYIIDSDGVVRSQQYNLQQAPTAALAALRPLLPSR